MRLGVIDDIIEEPQGGAHENHEGIAKNIKDRLIISLEELSQYSPEDLIDHRYNKYRKMGLFKEN